MTPAEAMVLLTYIGRIDHRTISKEDAKDWADLLDDIDLEDARGAAREHFRTDNRWLTPALLRGRVEAGQSASPAAVSVAEAMRVPDTGADESPQAYIRALRSMNGVPVASGTRQVGVRAVRGELA